MRLTSTRPAIDGMAEVCHSGTSPSDCGEVRSVGEWWTGAHIAPGWKCFALRGHRVRSLLRVPAPKKRYSKWAELAFGIPSRNNRIVVHDGSSRLFIRRLENRNPRIDPTECRTGKNQDAVVKELLKPQKVALPDLLLRTGDRCGEVVPRWMQEIDPFRHTHTLAQLLWRFNLGCPQHRAGGDNTTRVSATVPGSLNGAQKPRVHWTGWPSTPTWRRSRSGRLNVGPNPGF